MYKKGYGIIETLAPLHVGASAGEETGNLNLIFRDQFTRTGIIPGSSLRGRFRADSRQMKGDYEGWYGRDSQGKNKPKSEDSDEEKTEDKPKSEDSDEEKTTDSDRANKTTEGLVKFEYASLLWLPIFCPGQPIVRVTSPALLKRYYRLNRTLPEPNFEPYTYCPCDRARVPHNKQLFFNLGFLPLKKQEDTLKDYLPEIVEDREDYLLVVVKDKEIGTIHDMGLYRQSRVALKDDEKINDGKGFFNVEAFPENTVFIFPLAIKPKTEMPDPWIDFLGEFNGNAEDKDMKELYFGGLESVGFGRTKVMLQKSSQSVVSVPSEVLNIKPLSDSWQPYDLDHYAQELANRYRGKKVLGESHKMRMTVAYGLERFWGEPFRLDGQKEKDKADYWRAVWSETAQILASAGITLPDRQIPPDNTQEIQKIAKEIWEGTEEEKKNKTREDILGDRKVALMVLTQFCDCLVWWTQRYK
ncbi:RAMP superfamily CRISPR-associated protein [Spirulina sp. 06S082]|uniref:RAMP superfamily CRISPR-associated protein n=1 Tax=Spirulina sp. 06S082 TaxID=3110248 RepID=UPI002B201ECE|nr:RAMP superfamily CRISPR-associated protein [Spirulina sp. 06S082]MEA5471119.1 RAMP superfamily CRISPR-associated protein [Spirulina sp. 06S082]